MLIQQSTENYKIDTKKHKSGYKDDHKVGHQNEQKYNHRGNLIYQNPIKLNNYAIKYLTLDKTTETLQLE